MNKQLLINISRRDKFIIVILIILFAFSCNGSKQPVIQPNTETKTILQTQLSGEERKVQTVSINNFLLKLANDNGKCSFSYKNKLLENSPEINTTLDINAPCNFIRKPWDIETPLFYTYGKKNNKHAVAIIVGSINIGDAKQLEDRLLFTGCGTENLPIRLFNDKIEIGKLESFENGGAVMCPDGGEDEVFFATSEF